jgi:beta-lactamase superfamily II metal-dependent hydrolase
MSFTLRMLGAGHGDALLVEYGAGPSRILVDGGTPATFARVKAALEALPPAERHLELLVVTHVDDDHIGGTLALFEKGIDGLAIDEIWFNGYRHLKEVEEFGPVQGERLTTQLWPRMDRWNARLGGKAVVVPDGAPLPAVTLPGGMELTLLSPTRGKLLALLPRWEKVCEEAGLVPQVEPSGDEPPGLEPFGAIDVDALAGEPFAEDHAEANGSSIAFLARHEGRSVLFGADAHPSVLAAAIARLPGGALEVDAFKLPHHGSKKNLSHELVSLVDTPRWLFSTSGARFKHPDRQTVARILDGRQHGDCELIFNYRSAYTAVWDDDDLRADWGYTTTYGDADGSVAVEL